MRQHEGRGDRQTSEESARGEKPAGGGHHQRQEQGRGVEEEGQLVQQRQACERSDPDPEAVVAAPEDPRHQHHGPQVEQWLERVHREQVTLDREDRGQRHANAGEDRAPAEPLGETAGEEYGRAVRQGRGEAIEREMAVRKRPGQARDQRDERRLIDVPPVQPSPAGEEVHLVPEPSVSAGDREMEGDRQERQHQRRAGFHPRGP